MKVALDTHCLYVTQAGTARYVRGLLSGFAKLGTAVDAEIIPFAWEVENLGYRQPQRALRTAYREMIWAPFLAPRIVRQLGVDLLHRTAPSLAIKPPCGIREIVTLHDLALLRHPERFRRWQRASGIRRLQDLGRADRIICDSRFTADEAMALLKINAKKLEVVHLGIGLDVGESGEMLPEIPESFFLFVGSLEPGKNLALLRACYLLAESRGVALPTLLVVGVRWSGVPSEGAPLKNWRFIGHVTDPILAKLYIRAVALLFPSKYEGFGFPLLEAMMRGCPVICGRVASLPELGGDAACYAPLEPEPFLKAMLQLLGTSEFRDDLGARGKEQSNLFSWESCARQTLAVYHSTL